MHAIYSLQKLSVWEKVKVTSGAPFSPLIIMRPCMCVGHGALINLSSEVSRARRPLTRARFLLFLDAQGIDLRTLPFRDHDGAGICLSSIYFIFYMACIYARGGIIKFATHEEARYLEFRRRFAHAVKRIFTTLALTRKLYTCTNVKDVSRPRSLASLLYGGFYVGKYIYVSLSHTEYMQAGV